MQNSGGCAPSSIAHPDQFCPFFAPVLLFIEPPVMIPWLDHRGCSTSRSGAAACREEEGNYDNANRELSHLHG